MLARSINFPMKSGFKHGGANLIICSNCLSSPESQQNVEHVPGLVKRANFSKTRLSSNTVMPKELKKDATVKATGLSVKRNHFPIL